MKPMITAGLCLILLGAALALVGCLSVAPEPRQPVTTERRAVLTGEFSDRNARGQMSIPDTAPDGTSVVRKWTTIESAAGNVFYAKPYIHKPKPEVNP